MTKLKDIARQDQQCENKTAIFDLDSKNMGLV